VVPCLLRLDDIQRSSLCESLFSTFIYFNSNPFRNSEHFYSYLLNWKSIFFWKYNRMSSYLSIFQNKGKKLFFSMLTVLESLNMLWSILMCSKYTKNNEQKSLTQKAVFVRFNNSEIQQKHFMKSFSNKKDFTRMTPKC